MWFCFVTLGIPASSAVFNWLSLHGPVPTPGLGNPDWLPQRVAQTDSYLHIHLDEHFSQLGDGLLVQLFLLAETN
jgi:hypothetical protein